MADSNGIVPSSALCDIVIMNIPVVIPPLAAEVVCKLVCDKPGAAQTAFTFVTPADSNLEANIAVKHEFANLV